MEEDVKTYDDEDDIDKLNLALKRRKMAKSQK